MITCLFVLPAHAKYSGGTGGPNDPYQIATAADLIVLGETPDDYDKHFILTADIDLDPNLPGRKVFDKALIAPGSLAREYPHPVLGSPFTGVFDGNGHTISHLTIEGGYDLGVFGKLEGEVKNLGVVDVNITGVGDYVGGLVGYNTYGYMTRCYSTGEVSGVSHVGGLVGKNLGEVTNCYSSNTVVGTGFLDKAFGDSGGVGGLVGTNTGIVAGCHSDSAVTGHTNVGGLVGLGGGIVRSYSSGAVSGVSEVGGLVGRGGATACFWDTQTSGQARSDGGTGKTTVEMQTASTFLDAGWDFVEETANGTEDIWKISEGLGYPRLWWEKYSGGTGEPDDPYLIYTAEQLNAVGAEPNDWDKHFKLMADIDLSGYSYNAALIAPDVDPCDPAFQGMSFQGVFDGSGHTIWHLTITDESYLGLFGRLEAGAEIKNLGVVDVNIAGSDYVGGIVAFSRGNIRTSYCTGTISGDKRIGGLTGRNWGAINACCNAAAVTGNDDIGGLAAGNYGSIINSHSTGAVTGNRDLGGLVGENYGSIATSYSTGTISGLTRAGGLVGFNYPDSGTVTDCFWDIETSSLASSDGGTGKTTAEMQTASTFLDSGWDFVGETANGTEDIWWILEGKDYPRLWWQAAPE